MSYYLMPYYSLNNQNKSKQNKNQKKLSDEWETRKVEFPKEGKLIGFISIDYLCGSAWRIEALNILVFLVEVKLLEAWRNSQRWCRWRFQNLAEVSKTRGKKPNERFQKDGPNTWFALSKQWKYLNISPKVIKGGNIFLGYFIAHLESVSFRI